MKIACQQPSPQVYKPRKGIVNGNKDKFRPMALDFMFNYARDLLNQFDYAHLFLADGTAAAENFDRTDNMLSIESFNEKSLKLSIFNLYEAEDVTSIMINYPALLLRKKSEIYPEGRTSYRFKRMLRNKVTIVGKSAFAEVKEDAAPKMTELDQPETEEPMFIEEGQDDPNNQEEEEVVADTMDAYGPAVDSALL